VYWKHETPHHVPTLVITYAWQNYTHHLESTHNRRYQTGASGRVSTFTAFKLNNCGMVSSH
jgi:hypothetical protein